jgi:hypothetical protein
MNTLAADAATHRPVPTFLTHGFRPFFLAAGLWSASALLLWIVMFATGSTIPSRFGRMAESRRSGRPARDDAGPCRR